MWCKADHEYSCSIWAWQRATEADWACCQSHWFMRFGKEVPPLRYRNIEHARNWRRHLYCLSASGRDLVKKKMSGTAFPEVNPGAIAEKRRELRLAVIRQLPDLCDMRRHRGRTEPDRD